MNKIIFLDIDGVLNVYCEDRDEYGCTFHKHFEDNLRYIIEQTDAKIVISSSWRSSGLEIMREMWEKRGLAGEIIDITNPIYSDNIRGYEIKECIDNNSDKILKYCIIDDDSDMLEEQKQYFVQTSNNQDHQDCIDIGYGLTKTCAERVVEILNN